MLQWVRWGDSIFWMQCCKFALFWHSIAVMLVILYKGRLSFESMDEILSCDHQFKWKLLNSTFICFQKTLKWNIFNNSFFWNCLVSVYPLWKIIFNGSKMTNNVVTFYSSSAWAVTKEFICVIIWSCCTPWTFGPNSGTAVVSSAAVDEWEHATEVTSGSFAAWAWNIKMQFLIDCVQ